MRRPWIYGSAVPALTYNESGLVNGDTLSGLLATTATTTSNVGSYGDHPGHARRFGELRAELCQRQSHRHCGAAHRHRRMRRAEIYGAANPALTYTDTGLVNGDTLSGLLATTATATSNVGSLCDHPRHARRLGELRAELCRRQPHRDGGAAHRHRQCAEHDLRQRRSGPDL